MLEGKYGALKHCMQIYIFYLKYYLVTPEYEVDGVAPSITELK